jgi:hypothetical protein
MESFSRSFNAHSCVSYLILPRSEESYLPNMLIYHL